MAKSAMIALLVAAMAVVPIVHGAATLSATGLTVAGRSTAWGSEVCLTPSDISVGASGEFVSVSYDMSNSGDASHAAHNNKLTWDAAAAGIYTDAVSSALAAGAARTVSFEAALTASGIGSKPFDATIHDLTLVFDADGTPITAGTVKVAFCNFATGVCGCTGGAPTGPNIHAGSDLKVVSSSNTVTNTAAWGQVMCLTDADLSTYSAPAPMNDRKLLQATTGFRFQFTEANDGSDATGNFNNELLYDGSRVATATGRSSLAAGATRTALFGSSSNDYIVSLTPDANVHTLKVNMDYLNSVAEASESNVFEIQVAFCMSSGVCGCPASDLTSPTLKTIKGGSVVQTTEYGSTICLTEADWTCNVQAPSSDRKLLQSCSSQGFLFEYIEKNIGSGSAAGAYINQVLFDGSVIQTDSGRSTLAAAASRDVRSSSLLDLTPDANTHTLTVKLDTGSGVSEADEANTFTANVAFKMNGVNGCDPTVAATDAPTGAPTVAATDAPTAAPTLAATDAPTAAPTLAATDAPTAAPTLAATDAPTAAPTLAATDAPTAAPRTCSPCAGSLVARVDCTCVSALRGSVSLETPIEAFMALGNDKFSESFAGALGLEDPEQVRVLSAQAGSTIVDFAVVPPLGSSSLDIAMEDDLVAKLNAGGLDLGAAYGTPSVLGLTRPNGANAIAATPAPTVAATPAPTGAPVVAATPAPTAADDDVIPPTAPTVKEEEDTPVALYGAIGGGALLVGLCLFFGVRRYRANKKQGEMERNPVASMDEAGLNPKFNKAEVTDVENPKAGAPLSSPAAAPERKPFGELN